MALPTETKTIWEFFISHHRFAVLIVITSVFLGLFSVIQIPKESNPEIDVPFATVITILPGASAEDVEELVTDIIEDKILSLDEVENLTSTSSEGISQIGVEFAAAADSDKKIEELRDKVNEAQIDLPEDAEDSIVRKIRFSDQPVVIFSLSGPYTVPQLKQFAEELADGIERISGVSKVEISGGQDREIQVIVEKDRLDGFGLTIIQVTNAIRRANADIPTGSIETAGARYTLRLEGRLGDVVEVKKIPITTIGNSPVFVEDVAQVIDGYEEKTSISRLSVGGSVAQPAITLQVFKTTGGNIVRIGESVGKEIVKAEQEFLPENVVIEEIQNIAKFISDDLNNLAKNGMQTVLILMILLLAFLGWREALLAGAALPLTFLITFAFLFAIGSTLNFLTLFSLILSIGILIDSAIIIVEGMYEQMTKRGKNSKEAAILTVRTFRLPLMAGTLTTVFAFLPMLLMSGILGEFIKHIPITVTIVLLSSLFVAFALIPVLGMKWLRPRKVISNPYSETWSQTPNIRQSRIARLAQKRELFDKFANAYEKTLMSLLETRKYKRNFVIALVLLFIFSSALPVSGVLKINMFPEQDAETFFIDIEEPVGTPLETTLQSTEKIEQVLREDPRIESFTINIGSGTQLGIAGGASFGSHFGNIIVNLKEDHGKKSYIIVEDYQKELPPLVDSKVSVAQQSGGPPTGAPVVITISGKSLQILDDLGKEFEAILEEIPGTRNIQTSIKEPSGEFVLHIDRAKAQLYGVSTIEIAQTLRNAVSGTTATIIRKEGEEMDVVVKYALDPSKVQDGKTNIVNLSTIESLVIATSVGDIPLSAFTRSELRGGRLSIQHEDGKRIVRVTSLTSGGATAQQIFSQVRQKAQALTILSGYQVKMGGEAEDIQQSYNDMFRAMILAVFLIGSALVLQFRSYRQPLFILAIIPLSLIGVFPGLALVGQPLSFPGIIGIVALTGIVVNDAIILIDRINTNRRKAMIMIEAIREAGKARLQPIILTTITTVAGILPITLDNELWRSLGFAIIFGLLFATVLTLFVIPMLYLRFADRKLDEMEDEPPSQEPVYSLS